MADQPAGPLLDALGVTINLDEHQQLTDVMVVGRVSDFADDGSGTALVIGSNRGNDWIAQLGMLAAARLVLEAGVNMGGE